MLTGEFLHRPRGSFSKDSYSQFTCKHDFLFFFFFFNDAFYASGLQMSETSLHVEMNSLTF